MAITFAAGAYIDKSGVVTDWDVNAGSKCLWFRRNGTPGGNQPVICGKYSSSGSNAGIGLFLEASGAGKLGMQVKAGGGQVNLIYHSVENVFDGNWHLAAYDWNQTNGAACNLWHNGVKTTANNTGAWAWSLQGIRYARSSDSFWGSFDGQLAHGCWWNVQLTAMEHYLLACGAHPLTINPGAIIMYLPMDDAAIVRDYGRSNLSVTTSGTLTRSVFEPPIGPQDMGFLFDKGSNTIINSASTVRRKFKVFRTARI